MIAISYRREDTKQIVGRIHDYLAQAFSKPNVFLDFDSIPPGVDFRDHIAETIKRSKVVLVVIGSRWAGNRIHQGNDFVRMEVAAALELGRRIIPVLIDDAQMPKPESLPEDIAELAFRNAVRIDSGPDFPHHINKVITSIRKYMEEDRKPATTTPPVRQKPPAPRPQPVRPQPTPEPVAPEPSDEKPGSSWEDYKPEWDWAIPTWIFSFAFRQQLLPLLYGLLIGLFHLATTKGFFAAFLRPKGAEAAEASLANWLATYPWAVGATQYTLLAVGTVFLSLKLILDEESSLSRERFSPGTAILFSVLYIAVEVPLQLLYKSSFNVDFGWWAFTHHFLCITLVVLLSCGDALERLFSRN